jgi:hypothetical protein
MNDNTISDYFLKDIIIVQNSKVLRQGQLLLFYVKDFYLHFTLKVGNQTKQFEIPYPFDTKRPSPNMLLLDYTLSSFRAEFNDIERKIKNIGLQKKSRYYNSIVRVQVLQ